MIALAITPQRPVTRDANGSIPLKIYKLNFKLFIWFEPSQLELYFLDAADAENVLISPESPINMWFTGWETKFRQKNTTRNKPLIGNRCYSFYENSVW